VSGLAARVGPVILALALGPGCGAGARPYLTEVGGEACRNIAEDEQARRGVAGESVQDCPAPPGVGLLVVDNGGQTWPVLEWQGRAWSLAPIVARHRPGDTPTLGSPPAEAGGLRRAPDRVEWWLGPDGSAEALTFRISGQSAERPGRWRSRLVAVRLSRAGGVCLLGTFEGAGANEAARQAVASGRPCPEAAEPAAVNPRPGGG
jgi:hypothetical protein